MNKGGSHDILLSVVKLKGRNKPQKKQTDVALIAGFLRKSTTEFVKISMNCGLR